jgi:uncharacterized protein YijF (DUF1287 family)
MQLEAVLQMLQLGSMSKASPPSAETRATHGLKRGTLFRSAVDVLRRAGSPMTPRGIATALIADKAVPATRKQFVDLQAAIHVALRKSEGVPARWRLKEAA